MASNLPQESESEFSKAQRKKAKKARRIDRKHGEQGTQLESKDDKHERAAREQAVQCFHEMDGLVVPSDCKKEVLERNNGLLYNHIKAGNPVRATKSLTEQDVRVIWYNELDKQHTFNILDKVTALNCAMVKNALAVAKTNIFERANIPPMMLLYLEACTERRQKPFEFTARDRFLEEWRKPSSGDIHAFTQSQIRRFGQETTTLRAMRAFQGKKTTEAEVLKGIEAMEHMEIDTTTLSGERADRDMETNSQEASEGIENMEKSEMDTATLSGKHNSYAQQTPQGEVSLETDFTEMDLDNHLPFYVDTAGEPTPQPLQFQSFNKGDDELLLAGDFHLASGPAYNTHMKDAHGKEKTDQDLAELHQSWVEGMYEALCKRTQELLNMKNPDSEVLDAYLATMDYIQETGAEEELLKFKGKAEEKFSEKLGGLGVGMDEESEI